MLESRQRRPARRTALKVLVTIALVGLAGLAPPAAAEDAAVAFMKRAARDLIAAARSGSQKAFEDAITGYGHVPAIGLYALGNYKPQLQPADRSSYYSGMVRFLARFAAAESQRFVVSHAEIQGPAANTEQGVLVDSRVHLKDGGVYDVRWLLIPQGSTFRVRDAQVMGFWMSPFLKDLFEKYIGQQGGDPRALVVALNR